MHCFGLLKRAQGRPPRVRVIQGSLFDGCDSGGRITGPLVATLPDLGRFRVIVRTGWHGVSILRLHEIASLFSAASASAWQRAKLPDHTQPVCIRKRDKLLVFNVHVLFFDALERPVNRQSMSKPYISPQQQQQQHKDVKLHK